jgi:hypothetical protein
LGNWHQVPTQMVWNLAERFQQRMLKYSDMWIGSNNLLLEQQIKMRLHIRNAFSGKECSERRTLK